MSCALHHVVAELGGLGSMAHLTGPWAGAGLRLLAVDSLPATQARQWEDRVVRHPTSPVDRMLDGKCRWRPIRTRDSGRDPGTDPLPEHSGSAAVSGIVVVPMVSQERVLGTLSVICLEEEPTAEECSFLEEVAHLVARHLGRSLTAPRGASSEWWLEQDGGSRLSEAAKAVSVGSWDWNIRTGELLYDEQAMRVLGIDPDTYDRRIESWVDMVHPDDLPWVMAGTDEAIRTRSLYRVEYRIRRPDGTSGWAQARGRVIIGPDGEPAHMVGTVWDTTHTRAARDAVDHALWHMTDGFAAVDADWRITFANPEAERALGPVPDTGDRSLWAIPAAQTPGFKEMCRRTISEGRPVSTELCSSANQRWYGLRLVPVPQGLTIYSTDITDRKIRNAEREAAERSAAERSARIARLTGALAEAITMRDVVEATAEHVLAPFGATRLAVLTMEDRSPRVVGSIGYGETQLDVFRAHGPPFTAPVAEVLTTRVPLFITSTEEHRARYPLSAEVLVTDEDQSWAFLPLIVSGQVTGCCVIDFAGRQPLSGEERTLLTALSGFIAQALERARLYDSEHNRAQELQRGLLPQKLPPLLAIGAAARYLPADRRLDVGGDWYDLIELSAERAALVIGDVMGHGLSEAATMGRLRTAVRTLAELELPPDEILTHLNDLVSDLSDDSYATCLYAVYDPTTCLCEFASAGHLPPVVIHPDHTVHIPEVPTNSPLGAATPPFDVVQIEVPANSLLALFTDGLVESPGQDIDECVDRFTGILDAAIGKEDQPSLETLCDTIVSALLPTQKKGRDDAALFLARAHALTAENVAVWPLPTAPTAAHRARELVRGQLPLWHLDDLVMTTELVVSELLGNVVRHARGPVALRLLRGRSLFCEVSDGSLTTPHIRRASDTDEDGRGLQLISALTHRWGVRYGASGKTIWTEQLLHTLPAI
ncbi:putative regulatory protein phosphatase [Streptomyces bingchenggensis BCW-1]|uniref:protein-serine/threonine phosphatase n=1 Tax=Streptomyces bingchenggensis (strain BCW-1) TaxID=749414 RepID=D7C9X4_STRBB|nr:MULTISPECIES: SpoIIE family protein phosphatase [Streptomyces]ADI04302.1 putative regulatory protein phosphatase [Streptomyces bingchenggensis BCW-1]